jgi:hypothetical protein
MNEKQMTLAASGFEKYAKTTRRTQFLAEMERVVPWAELCALIEPVVVQISSAPARACDISWVSPPS